MGSFVVVGANNDDVNPFETLFKVLWDDVEFFLEFEPTGLETVWIATKWGGSHNEYTLYGSVVDGVWSPVGEVVPFTEPGFESTHSWSELLSAIWGHNPYVALLVTNDLFAVLSEWHGLLSAGDRVELGSTW